MKRRVSPFIVALPAFIIVAIFKVFPIISAFVLSLFNYTPKQGLSGSEFVGFSNYAEFFSSFYFGRLMRNTVFLTVLPAIITAVVSFIAILFILKLPNRWLRGLALTVIAIPAFLPVSIVSGVIIDLVGPDSFVTRLVLNLIGPQNLTGGASGNLLTEPAAYPWIYSSLETLRYMFYPIAIGVLAAGNSDSFRKDVSTALRVVGGFVLVRFAFLMFAGRELTISLYNPMVYETSDTFTSFSHRKGLLEGQYSFTHAVETFRTIIQVLLNILLFFGVKVLVDDRKDAGYTMPDRKTGWPKWLIGVVGCLLVSVGSIAIVSNLFSGLLGAESSFEEAFSKTETLGALRNSIVYSLFAALLFSFISAFLAYPLTTNSKVYPVILFMFMGISLSLSEYSLYHNLGWVDRGISVGVSGGVAFWGALLIHLFTRNRVKNISDFGEYLNVIAPMIAVTFVLGYVKVWGSSDAVHLLRDSTKFPISIFYRSLFFHNTRIPDTGEGIEYFIGLIGSVPPLLVGWLLIWLNRVFFKKQT